MIQFAFRTISVTPRLSPVLKANLIASPFLGVVIPRVRPATYFTIKKKFSSISKEISALKSVAW
jgi:hypothetical protein